MEISGSLEMQLLPSISISYRIPRLHPEVASLSIVQDLQTSAYVFYTL
jgi:hypothetical protein